jgi:acyl-ACP thioesterase
MPATRSAFPRAAVVKNDKGEELYRCTTLWALVNKHTRKLVLPADSGVTFPGCILGDELPVPNSFAALPQGQLSARKVCFSELDLNGHMNNTKYLDWVNDLLPSQFHKEHAFRDVNICYLSEALEGQTVTLSLNHLEDGSLQVDGLRSETNDLDKKNRVFSVKVSF